MNRTSASPTRSGVFSTRVSLYVALVVITAFFLTTAMISSRNAQALRDSRIWLAKTHEVIVTLNEIIGLVTDAETGQRGFIITGSEEYLDVYNAALLRIDADLSNLSKLVLDNPDHLARLPSLQASVAERRTELATVLDLARTDGLAAARERILGGRGRVVMGEVRRLITEMKETEGAVRRTRLAQSDAAYDASIQSALINAIVGVVLVGVIGWLMERAGRQRQRDEWLKNGQAQLTDRLVGELQIEELGQNALSFLCDYLGANAGAIFMREERDFRRAATYAVPASATIPERFSIGEGLLGQAAKEGRSFRVRNVPEGYLSIGSSLGQHAPRELLIIAAKGENAVISVIELGFFAEIPPNAIELASRCSEVIGVAVRSAQSRTRIVTLLEETQRQSEELQTQSEELRVSNEELEEQSRALQQTQVRLELQQAELEASNTQLEEQTQLLEMQKNDLTQSKLQLENQARIVEQASRYKSDFLANMSHELRTPLNSSLILAQLLAENRTGNLNEEQVKFARTIQSAGNDLLALINDVLDLSKIEAGRMDIRPEHVNLGQLVERLRAQFAPIAGARGLSLNFHLPSNVPDGFETDPQRLEQVLRNLLSNALKFTERGEVALTITRTEPARLAFAVSDTGIGIDPKQQRIVFEPFCQADGTTNRKFGGTGLGLSISRELTRLLGGEIRLESEPGRGSTFTVLLPETFTAPAPKANEITAAVPANLAEAELAVPAPKAAPRPRSGPIVRDDREILTASNHVILLVEDDARFAELMVGLVREQNFQCLVTSSAEEALAFAREYLPNAVLLDIGLPDGSGLFVLESLKRDARTRHIPVHVISGSDYAEKAMRLGAIGYMLKPVPREKIVDALRTLEARLAQRVRRVLVVEDDEVQRAAVCKLLGSREVETMGAHSAEDCLAQLRSNTFDCMVLDLSLPDASGFSVLQTMDQDQTCSFPPVVIYTGRELSADEEQLLRRYSKSIIIKGAKSPERLLDEVALFLHQVVAELPDEKQKMIEKARSRESALEGRRVLLVEDDVRNVFAITSLLEPLGLSLEIARNGREALEALERSQKEDASVDLVLMDIMMPEMDGLTAMREIRQRGEWKKLPIIALTAKATPSDQEQCLAAGANDYLAKPLDVGKLLSLVRVWMPR